MNVLKNKPLKGDKNIRRVNNYTQVDIKLLKACSKNKRKAHEELYKTCFPILLPICKRFHHNLEEAILAYNDAFIKIIDNLHKLNLEEVIFIPWAKRVTINLLIDNYRRNKKYNEHIFPQNDERKLEFLAKGVPNKAEVSSAEDRILFLLEYLKPETKQVFILYAIEGYKHKEISEIMKMSVGTSKWHLSNARKELKRLLEILEKKEQNNMAI